MEILFIAVTLDGCPDVTSIFLHIHDVTLHNEVVPYLPRVDPFSDLPANPSLSSQGEMVEYQCYKLS